MSVQLGNGTVKATTLEISSPTSDYGSLTITHTGTSSESLSQRIEREVANKITHPANPANIVGGTVLYRSMDGDLSWERAGVARPSSESSADNGKVLKKTDNGTVWANIDISGKADKVTSATSGNLAGLDANGNLTDSGKSASSFVQTTGQLSQSVAGTLNIDSVYVGGTRVAVVNSIPTPPEADVLYFVLGDAS